MNVELRSLNLLSGLCVLYPICLALLDRRPNQQAQEQHSSQSRRNLSSIKTFAHTAVNICLFPPLFFFYALYYTDVLSAALVLLSYCSFHARMTKTMLVLSLIALLFRQTNIFWITVYFGALEVVRNIQQSPSEAEFSDHPTFGEVITKSWQTGRLYDCLASESCFEGLNSSLLYISSLLMSAFRLPKVRYLPHDCVVSKPSYSHTLSPSILVSAWYFRCLCLVERGSCLRYPNTIYAHHTFKLSIIRR